MRELARQVRMYREKGRFLAPHARRRNELLTRWAFLRRRAYVTWPLYGLVLPALRDGRLEIAPHTTFLAGCWLSLPGEGRLRIGHHTYLNLGVTIHAYGLVEIGDYTAVSSGSFISDATHRVDDPDLPFLEQPMTSSRPVRIGSHVWLGVNSVVMPGVTIGDHAIVGSNSVVTRDVAPYTVVAGAPARLLRRLDEGGTPPEAGS